MIGYLLRRLMYTVVIIVLLTLVIFGITQVLPGNAARMILGSYQSQETLKALEQKLGLDQPLPTQYWRWASRFLHGDLGDSLVMNRPVAPILSQAIGNTLRLASLAMLSVVFIGITFGVAGAVAHRRFVDYALGLLSFTGLSLPEFFWGIVLIIVFAGSLRMLPAAGIGDIHNPVDLLRHMILPVATLTFTLVAHVARQTRSSMLEVLRANYISVARAKGLSPWRVISRHALRNALLPTITVLAFDFGYLVGEIAVVETVFAYPGFGRLMILAIQQRDLPMIQACGMVATATYALTNLTADFLYAYFNPKIRIGHTA
jgi:peptide/nickel transport system permease protein